MLKMAESISGGRRLTGAVVFIHTWVVGGSSTTSVSHLSVVGTYRNTTIRIGDDNFAMRNTGSTVHLMLCWEDTNATM